MTLIQSTQSRAQSLTCSSIVSDIDTTHSRTYTQHLYNSLIKKHTTAHKAINRYLSKYIHIIIDDMYRVYTSPRHKVNSAYWYMNITEHRTRWGRLTIDKKIYWATDIILQHMFAIPYPGHNGTASGIDIKNQLLLNAIKEHADKFNPPPRIVTSTNFIETYVNRKSLTAYANDKQNDLRYRRNAKTIINSLDKDDLFKQEIKQPVINRSYLLGLNLQQVKGDVRAAALSGQWSYDINCAIFALFAAVAHELTNKPCTLLLDYITDRTSIRQDIADQTGLDVKAVKDALTSVGFGKRAKKANDLAVVMTTKRGRDLVKEFRKASSIIYKNFKTDLPRAKRLSDLFFTWEAELLNEFIFRCNQKPNLTVYDCVIFCDPISVKHILPTIQLSFTSHTEYFNFEETQL